MLLKVQMENIRMQYNIINSLHYVYHLPIGPVA